MYVLIGQLCLMSVMAGASGPGTADADPRAWLQRMSSTMETLNYEGTFVHIINGDAAETMRIIHRVRDGHVSERLIALDGSGREIIRNNDEVRCILQEEKTVVVERQETGQYLPSLPNFQVDLDKYYDFKIVGHERVANRDTRVIEIRPRDEFRYGQRLSLDEQTAMPLRSSLIDSNGKIVEQVLFTSITLRDDIADTELEQRLSSDGYKWFVGEQQSDKDASANWKPDELPTGFELTVARTHDGTDQQRDQYVYSDGLASVSVFVEQAASTEPMQGLSTIGSANAYATMIDGFQITTVGEVPPSTVKMIGTSIKRNRR